MYLQGGETKRRAANNPAVVFCGCLRGGVSRHLWGGGGWKDFDGGFRLRGGGIFYQFPTNNIGEEKRIAEMEKRKSIYQGEKKRI